MLAPPFGCITTPVGFQVCDDPVEEGRLRLDDGIGAGGQVAGNQGRRSHNAADSNPSADQESPAEQERILLNHVDEGRSLASALPRLAEHLVEIALWSFRRETLSGHPYVGPISGAFRLSPSPRGSISHSSCVDDLAAKEWVEVQEYVRQQRVPSRCGRLLLMRRRFTRRDGCLPRRQVIHSTSQQSGAQAARVCGTGPLVSEPGWPDNWRCGAAPRECTGKAAAAPRPGRDESILESAQPLWPELHWGHRGGPVAPGTARLSSARAKIARRL